MGDEKHKENLPKEVSESTEQSDVSSSGTVDVQNEVKKAEAEAESVEKNVAQKIEDNEYNKEDSKDLKEKEEEVAAIQEDLKKETKSPKKSSKKEKKKSVSNKKTDNEDTDEEISLNLDKAKAIFNKKNLENSYNQIVPFFKKYGIILLVLIPIFLSIFFRAYPIYLPQTDVWAENSVYSSIENQVRSQVESQVNPNLPQANKDAMVRDQFQQILDTQGPAIEQQIELTSEQFKSRLQDDTGQTYLLAIDPWLWYGEIRASLETGFFGNEIVDGKEWYTLRNGRFGKTAEQTYTVNLHAGRAVYEVMSFFNKDVTLMAAFFLVPLIIVTLATIPAFFIGRKIAGNIAGLFAAIIVAINSALLSRTPAGFSDTDPYNVFFPLFIAWMFIEAMYAKTAKSRIIFSSVAGLLVGLYSKAWSGYWYPFVFILATLILAALFYGVSYYFRSKDKAFITRIKTDVSILVAFFVSSSVFILLLRGFNAYKEVLLGPFGFITLKDVAVRSFWPNVLTTVAEFNEVPLQNIVGQMGGTVLFWIGFMGIMLLITNLKSSRDWWFLGGSALYYLLVLAYASELSNAITFMAILSVPFIVGLVLIFWYKETNINVAYPTFLLLWLFSTMYAFTKGTRFAILMVPAFALAFGAALGITHKKSVTWFAKIIDAPKILISVVLVLIFALLLIQPLQAAHSLSLNEIPTMDDAWYESLIEIRDDSDDAIITSWWDFGHWFAAVSERRVTFDGADQGRRIHYVGKSLLTDSEEESVNILRTLNCGQQKGPNLLESFFDGDTPKAMDLLNKAMMVDKATAEIMYVDAGLTEEQVAELLPLTHCEDLIPQYYITSADMIGKSSVWGHFGSWDFNRAKMHNLVKGKSIDQGLKILEEQFNVTGQEADDIYFEIQAQKADSWVSPWPPYMGGPMSATTVDNIVTCSNGIQVNLTDKSVLIRTAQGDVLPPSLVYADEQGIHTVEYENATFQASVALIPQRGNNYQCLLADPILIDSTFTKLFFFEGHGMEHFEKFSDRTDLRGQRIIVWKVNFEGSEPFISEAFQEKTIARAGDTVSVNYIGWVEQDGQNMIFDASIIGWEEAGIDTNELFQDHETNPFSFTVGSGQAIEGFDSAVQGMQLNAFKFITIPPEEAYGTDPNAHPLGNRTLHFRIQLESIE